MHAYVQFSQNHLLKRVSLPHCISLPSLKKRGGASLVAQMVKILPAVQETQVWSLGQVVPLEKEMATDSIILAWKIPQRSLAGYSLWSQKELDTTVWIHFVKNKVPIGAWVYLLVLCLVPLVYISVFVPLPFCLDECSFVV